MLAKLLFKEHFFNQDIMSSFSFGIQSESLSGNSQFCFTLLVLLACGLKHMAKENVTVKTQ